MLLYNGNHDNKKVLILKAPANIYFSNFFSLTRRSLSFGERCKFGGIFYRPPPLVLLLLLLLLLLPQVQKFPLPLPSSLYASPLPTLSPPSQRIRNCPQSKGGLVCKRRDRVVNFRGERKLWLDWINYKRRNPGAEMKQEIWHFVVKCQNIFFMVSTKVASALAIIIQWTDASFRKSNKKSQSNILLWCCKVTKDIVF